MCKLTVLQLKQISGLILFYFEFTLHTVWGGHSVEIHNNSPSLSLSRAQFQVDSCVCTAYRKVDDIPAIPTSNGYPLSASSLALMPHHHAAAALHHHHHHLEAPTSASNGGPGGGGGTAAAATNQPQQQQQQNHAFLFPSEHHGHHHPGTTTTIIHRIDGNTAQALYGSLGAGGHHGGNSVIVVSGAGMFDISR